MTDGGTRSGSSTLAAVGTRPPLYRDATVLRWVAQVATLVLVLFAIWFLVTEAGDSLRASSVSIDFGFIGEHIGIKVGDGIDQNPDTGGRALWVGMVNTLRLASAGIVLATILGVLVGLARLSSNWPLKRMSSVYVELLRNIPLLVQILLWDAILNTLGGVDHGMGPISGWLHLSNKGMSVPRVFISDGFYQWIVIVIVGGVVARYIYKNLNRQREMTGGQNYAGLWAAAVVTAFAAIGWFAHPALGFLGSVFSTLSDVVGAIPQAAVQIAAVVAAIAIVVWWIRRFLASHRTPAGLTRLTDDDWFRMIFAVIMAAAVVFIIVVVWPGLSSWVVNSGSDGLGVLADKFGNGRTGAPIDAMRPDIVQPGNFPNYGPAGLTLPKGLAAVYFGVVFLHIGLHCRDRARGHLGCTQRAKRSSRRCGAAPLNGTASGDSPAGVPSDPPAAGQPVPQPDEEHHACYRSRLQRPRADRPNRLQPNR